MRRFILPLGLALAALVFYIIAQTADGGTVADVAPEVGPLADRTVTPVLSARRLPEFIVAPTADAAMAAELDSVIADSPADTCLVVSRAGRTIYSHNPDTPLVPASAQKVVTGAGVLEALGPDYTFTTTVSVVQPLDGGTLDGDLWLIGGGDPVLATAEYISRYPEPQLFTDLERLAQDLVDAGLTRVTGAVVGDETRYDTERYIDSWPLRFTNQGERPQNQTGPLSALSVNDAFSQWPTDSDANSLATAATDPAEAAAAAFDDLLEERGVEIDLSARSGIAPEGLILLGSLESAPLTEVVGQMLGSSDNSTAELLVKELGWVVAGEPNTNAGVTVLDEVLASDLGIAAGASRSADGSGLSSLNALSCSALVQLLDQAGPDSALAAGLAIAGETGTLRERFEDEAVRGRILAKTGSLNQVSALTGFALAGDEADDPVLLTFAYIANADDLEFTRAKAIEGEMGADLVSWPQGPDLAELSPAPAEAG